MPMPPTMTMRTVRDSVATINFVRIDTSFSRNEVECDGMTYSAPFLFCMSCHIAMTVIGSHRLKSRKILGVLTKVTPLDNVSLLKHCVRLLLLVDVAWFVENLKQRELSDM